MKTPITQGKKIYLVAPLPFMGQKRRFVWEFRDALKEFLQATTFIDLFGGSGLLSYTAKQVRPDARIIYNDFDDYHLRLANVGRTNALIADIRELVTEVPREKKLSTAVKERVLRRIAEDAKTGFVDYITLSSSLLFSMNYATTYKAFCSQTLYNVMKTNPYNCDGYLDGMEIVKQDYKQLFEQYKDRKDVVFIVDPPYLSTETGSYKGYWRLADYLDVLKVLKGTNYVYFTSDKSSIIELCTWLEKNLNADNPFAHAVVKKHSTTMNYSSGYIDMMLYKRSAA